MKGIMTLHTRQHNKKGKEGSFMTLEKENNDILDDFASDEVLARFCKMAQNETTRGKTMV